MKAHHHLAFVGVLASLGLVVAACAQDVSEQEEGLDPGAVLDTATPDDPEPAAASDCSPEEAQEADESGAGCLQEDGSDPEAGTQGWHGCRFAGQWCRWNHQCCSGNCFKGVCVGGGGACRLVGQFCSFDFQCCSGNCWKGRCRGW